MTCVYQKSHFIPVPSKLRSEKRIRKYRVVSFAFHPGMKNDIDLLHSAGGWSKDALEKIFELYASALYNYALRLGHDPIMADHIVGDVFAKLLEQIASGRGPTTNLRSYLYQATYHMIIDHGRSSRRNAPLEVVDSLDTDVHSTTAKVEDQAMFDLILKAMRNHLTEDQRHVIVLRFVEEFSLNETAAILGKEVGHIKVIQGRALAKLRKSLGDSGQ
jgi:RNA polymerase sigma-70 factor, ECF subfamily